MLNLVVADSWTFLPTPSARRATRLSDRPGRDLCISTHALREEGDLLRAQKSPAFKHFYPRPPRGGRPTRNSCPGQGLPISTHALREEGDTSTSPSCGTTAHFYPRPPRGGRPRPPSFVSRSRIFLPTPSARRATLHRVARFQAHEISTHALREEGDDVPTVGCIQRDVFLPTPSARRATHVICHPPSGVCHFYPRPPRGGRLPPTAANDRVEIFLPTPSARRATVFLTVI